MDTESEKIAGRRRSRSLVPVLLALWAGFIFFTSCFFIERSDFIRFVSRFLPAGLVRSEWANLWLVAGLVIVKTYHSTEYFILFTLVFLTLERIGRPSPRWRLPLTFILGFLFAASDEWHQTFVDGRGGTVVDVGIDSIGLVLAVLFFTIRRRRQSAKTDSV
jgi:hypothetical protein